MRDLTPRCEPLIPTTLPDYPWQKVASDLFQLKGVNYLVVVDYFSRYPEVIKLKSTTSTAIVEALKSIFSRHGIPETVVSDNRPQYTSQEFPQSNGHAERAVQTMKKLLKESRDPYMVLLTYRTTPLPWCNLTPAELLMGRKVRGNLPQVTEKLNPNWSYLEEFRKQDGATVSSNANRNRTMTADIESKACHPFQTSQKYGLHLDPSQYRGVPLQRMPQGRTSSKLILVKFT